MKRANIEKWADTFRLIEERDQQTIAAIDYVLDWLPTNSFWFGNIRSASKLRTQFEKLKFEIKNEKNVANNERLTNVKMLGLKIYQNGQKNQITSKKKSYRQKSKRNLIDK